MLRHAAFRLMTRGGVAARTAGVAFSTATTATPSVMDRLVNVTFVDPSGARRKVKCLVGKWRANRAREYSFFFGHGGETFCCGSVELASNYCSNSTKCFCDNPSVCSENTHLLSSLSSLLPCDHTIFLGFRKDTSRKLWNAGHQYWSSNGGWTLRSETYRKMDGTYLWRRGNICL